MMKSDYSITTKDGYISVGKLQNRIYVFSKMIKPNLEMHFYEISKEEHDAFSSWKQEEAKLDSICRRPFLYIGYFRSNELRKKQDH